MNANEKAFLDMLAFSEIGPKLLASSDRGYNVLVGGKLFNSYADHPRIKVFFKKWNLYSTAAGRYQILARYYDAYKKLLKLPDFSPDSQDKIALCMISEQGASQDVKAGRLELAIKKCRNIWASLPGAGYGQSEQRYASLENAFLEAGGGLGIA